MTKLTRAATLRAATFAVAVTSLVAAAPAHAGKWEAIEKLPGRSPVNLLVNDKPRAYFRIEANDSLLIPTEGPAQLRVISRVELPRDSKQALSYVLRASEGRNVLDRTSTESSVSSQARLEHRDKDVGKSRRMTADVPAGKHKIYLSTYGSAAVYVRLRQGAPPRGTADLVSLTPIEAVRSVLLAEGEKTIPYYTAMPGKPVKIRVVGPTKLELLLRLDYDATMRGTQAYKLVISEGARHLRNVELKTTKATTASYTNLPDRVPSKFDKLQLLIDDGTHEITIALLEPAGGSAEIHAQIPQPTVGDEE
jgi:hypothetical protein